MPLLNALDSTIFYRDTGTGMPFVFLHGNPTSSHIWRNVSPAITTPGRRLAPDLIDMGQSGKPDIAYTFADHARYPERVRGIAFMETIVRPMTWDDFPGARPRFEALRSPGIGETKVLDENFFIEQALKLTVLNGLKEEDHAVYAAPYPTRESRRPLLAWPRSMPIEGEPADVIERIEAYDTWLAESTDIPKLLLTFEGPAETLLIGEVMTAWCRENIADLEIRNCGPARHNAPEDQPEMIAAAISDWADRHALTR